MENAIKDYLNCIKITDILANNSLTQSQFYSLLKKHNVTKRLNSCKYPNKDTSYFEKLDTEDKLYLLGLIAADGCICHGYSVNVVLKAVDEDILRKYANIILGDKQALQFLKGTNRQDAYSLRLSGKKFCDDLLKYGITKSKSFTLDIQPLNDLPENLFRAFMLGMFDGDGSIFYKTSRDKYKYLNVSLINSVALCNRMAFLLEKYIKIKFQKTTIKCKNNKEVMTLRLQSQKESIKFLTWLYGCDIQCLERKKNIWLNFVKKYKNYFFSNTEFA